MDYFAGLDVLPGQPFKRIGLEARPFSQWFFGGLAETAPPRRIRSLMNEN